MRVYNGNEMNTPYGYMKETLLRINNMTKNAKKEIACPACAERMKHRDGKELKDLTNRLSRIEGQIRGVKNMLENDAYCIDVINQVSAAVSALNSFNRILLTEHMQSCVTDDIKDGNTEKMDELVKTIQKMMK